MRKASESRCFRVARSRVQMPGLRVPTISSYASPLPGVGANRRGVIVCSHLDTAEIKSVVVYHF